MTINKWKRAWPEREQNSVAVAPLLLLELPLVSLLVSELVY